MRRGFTLTEMVVVIIILPFVFLLLDGLFGTLLTEVPRSWHVAQQGSMLMGVLEQIHQDVEEAKALPAEFAGRTADDKLLLVELPEGVVGYQIEEGCDSFCVQRSAFSDAEHGTTNAARVWSVPDAQIEWQVWEKDGRRYAVEVKTHVEFKFHGRTEKKMAQTHLFYGGALR